MNNLDDTKRTDAPHAPDEGQPNPVVDVLSNAMGAMLADSDMHELMKSFGELNPRAIEKLTPAEARAEPTIRDAVRHLLEKQGRSASPETLVPGVVRTRIIIPGPGGPLPAFVYTPEGLSPPDLSRLQGQVVTGSPLEPNSPYMATPVYDPTDPRTTPPNPAPSPESENALPVVVYFHGGGWVIGSAEVYDAAPRTLAREAGAIVISVDYRLAPEHPFPAAWDDALASWTWAVDNATLLGGDPTRMALAGESAGGNLALSTAVAARDKGLFQPRHVLAVYPVTQTGDLHTDSYVKYAIAKPLSRAMVEWFVGHTFPNKDDAKNPRVDVLNANLEGLPPVTIVNAAIDPLRADGGLLETALRKAGVSCDSQVFEGVTHEFFGGTAVLEKARAAMVFAVGRLRHDIA
jgi:acetyl esterase/lipase